jgi:hypothetical protein
MQQDSRVRVRRADLRFLWKLAKWFVLVVLLGIALAYLFGCGA